MPRDPSRNLGKEKGPPVLAEEVLEYADEDHFPCRGTGSRRFGGKRTKQPCRCSTKGFLEAHPEVIIERDGRAWWPATKS